jgi:hypothetical protein
MIQTAAAVIEINESITHVSRCRPLPKYREDLRMETEQSQKWVIQVRAGQLLQSLSLDPSQIKIGSFIPLAPGKTKEGKKGPLKFISESGAQLWLMAMTAQIPKEFADAVVVPWTPAT